MMAPDPAIISAVGLSTLEGAGDFAKLEAGLAAISALGATAAELSLYGEELIVGGRVIAERAEKLHAVTRTFGLRYSVHGLVGGNFMDAAHLPQQMAVARAMLELCDRIGAGVLVHHAGHAPLAPGADMHDSVARQQDALLELAQLAQRQGVSIALENIFGRDDSEYRQSPSEVARTVAAIGHPNLCALIDFSHAYIECNRRGLDFRAEIAAMAPVTRHLHVHDSLGRPYTMRHFHHPSEATALGIGDLHLPVGWGDIPWQAIFSELTFLPGTTLILEVYEDRFREEQPASLAAAWALAGLANGKAAGR